MTTLNLTLPDNIIQTLRRLAGDDNTTVETIINEILAAWFKSHTAREGGSDFLAESSAVYTDSESSSVKQDVAALLEKLPDDCNLEDIQYQLYVLEKVQRGLAIADSVGAIPQAEAEERMRKWLIK